MMQPELGKYIFIDFLYHLKKLDFLKIPFAITFNWIK